MFAGISRTCVAAGLGMVLLPLTAMAQLPLTPPPQPVDPLAAQHVLRPPSGYPGSSAGQASPPSYGGGNGVGVNGASVNGAGVNGASVNGAAASSVAGASGGAPISLVPMPQPITQQPVSPLPGTSQPAMAQPAAPPPAALQSGAMQNGMPPMGAAQTGFSQTGVTPTGVTPPGVTPSGVTPPGLTQTGTAQGRIAPPWQEGAVSGAANPSTPAATAGGTSGGASATPVPPSQLAPGFPNVWLPAETAKIQALDKVNAIASILTVKVGQAVTFGSLTITVKACVFRPKDQPADSAAYVDVTDSTPDSDRFNGWLLQNEPAVSIMQNPIYDLRVAGCA